jgi:zinc transport system substrate-binding protein
VGFLVSGGSNALSAPEKSVEPVSVVVSILPQAYFVERIGGSRVSVEVLVHPGESPEMYRPSPDQIDGIVKSDIYFRIGMPFEEMLLPKLLTVAKKLQIVDTRKGIQLRRLPDGEQHQGDHENIEREHEHHTGVGHSHGLDGNDPHIWLSPRLVQKQAETIWHALMKLDPSGKEEYTANYNDFIRDIEALQKKISARLTPFKGKSIYVFHPAFGYFTDEYDLRQMAVEIEGKAPKGKQLARLIKTAKREKVRILFVQPQFDKSTAHKIADAINGKVIPIDPLARDYLANMEEMADKISEAFGE